MICVSSIGGLPSRHFFMDKIIKPLYRCVEDVFSDAHEIIIPWPPSVNNYYRPYMGRIVLSREARKYHNYVLKLALIERWQKKYSLGVQLCAVCLKAYPPSKGPHDVDNILKVILDLLQKSGVINNDRQIDTLFVARRKPDRGNPRVCLRLLPVV